MASVVTTTPTSTEPSAGGQPSTTGKTHRRVRSLVRDFDSIAHPAPANANDLAGPSVAGGPNGAASAAGPSWTGPGASPADPGPRRQTSTTSLRSPSTDPAGRPVLSVAPPIQTSRRLSSGGPSPRTRTFRTPSPSDPASFLGVNSAGMDRSSSSSSEEGAAAHRRSPRTTPLRPGARGTVGALGLQYGEAPDGARPSDAAGHTSAEDGGDTGEEDDVFVPLSTGSSVDFNFAPAPSPHAQGGGPSGDRHARRHSRLHSRNLSVFFPRPGQEVSGTLVGYNDPPDLTKVPVLMPSAKIQSYAMPGMGQPARSVSASSSGQPAGTGSPSDDGTPPAVTGRRGHHHRHSLSHNFFSFLDPTATNPSLTPTTSPSTPISALPKAVPQTLSHHHRTDSTSLPANPTQSLRSRYAHLPLPLRVMVAFAFHTPTATQLKLVVGFATLFLGGALWIFGQAGESLATTGLGYLVVFDGVGALSRIWVEGRAEGIDKVWDAAGASTHGHCGLRLPFGLRRQVTLAHFGQCVYLLFSAVYVCKEAVEHVLLLHGPGEDGAHNSGAHGSAHGSMGHGEALAMSSSPATHGAEAIIGVPTGILLICFVCCLFSALGSGNHAGLAEAAGPSTFTPSLASARGRKHTLGEALVAVLANPFVLITLLFSGGISVASICLQSEQLAPLDKVLALLESAAMFYIAYPAAVATGSVLLQTAPPLETGQMAALQRGLRQISDHPKVVFIQPPRIWQMTPQFHTAKPQISGLTGRSSQASRDAQASVVVASITVHIKDDASDNDVLEITRFSREKCGPALRWAAGLSRDLDQRKGSIDAGAGGELTVAVVRGFPDASSHQRHHHEACDHSHSH